MQALEESASLHGKTALRVTGADGGEAIMDLLGASGHPPAQGIVAPVDIDGRAGGDEGQVIPAEGPAVLTRLPDMEIATHEHEGYRQADAADGLGNGDEIRNDARRFEAEECPG